jgi:hypothetical protein
MNINCICNHVDCHVLFTFNNEFRFYFGKIEPFLTNKQESRFLPFDLLSYTLSIDYGLATQQDFSSPIDRQFFDLRQQLAIQVRKVPSTL